MKYASFYQYIVLHTKCTFIACKYHMLLARRGGARCRAGHFFICTLLPSEGYPIFGQPS